MEKSENIEYPWHYATDIFINSSYIFENIMLFNRNYWYDLGVIDQGHSRGNIS